MLLLSAVLLMNGGQLSVKRVAGASVHNKSSLLLALAALFFAVFFLLHR